MEVHSMDGERVVYMSGEIVPESEAKISIRDRGFVYGDAVFDTTRTFGGKIFKLQEHLERLFNSLKYMRLDPGMSQGQISDVTMQVLDANLPLLEEGDDYWVTQRFTRGVPGGDGPMKPTVIIECTPLPFKVRAAYYRDGLPVITPSVKRTPPEAMSPRAKMHNYINTVLADLEVKGQNPDAWAMMLDVNGNIAEGPGSNYFFVKDGVLMTPGEQYVLGGISRQTALELAQELSIETRETDIDMFDAYTADEAFVTSTSFCICPVSTINGTPIGEAGVPGPVTDRLQKAYSGLVGIDIVGQYLARLE
jgi:branched-chain amino acid aminotransferase